MSSYSAFTHFLSQTSKPERHVTVVALEDIIIYFITIIYLPKISINDE